jgi:hypothetical protein
MMKKTSMSLAAMALLSQADKASAAKLKTASSMSLNEKIKNQIIEQMNEGISIDTVSNAIQEEQIDEMAVFQ